MSFQEQTFLFYKTQQKSIFNVNDPEDVKYLTRLRLHFSYLNEHKFRHGFLDTLNPLCNCSLEVENNEHFFLRFLNFENARFPSSSIYQALISSLKNFPNLLKVKLLLFDHFKLSAIDNRLILEVSIKYIMTTNRFSVPLFWSCFPSLALNIYIDFFPPSFTATPNFLHCCIWESSETSTCAVFLRLFFGYPFVKYFSFVFCQKVAAARFELWTHKHLVRKQTLNHLAKFAKWFCCVVSTYLCDAFDYISL